MSLGAVCGPLWQCISHLAKNGEKLCIWDIICNKLCCYKNRVFESARSWRNSIVLKFPYDFLFSSEPLQADEKHLNRAGRWVACRVSGLFFVDLHICCLIAHLLLRHVNISLIVCSFHFFFRQVDPHGRGHRLHRAQHGHEARGGGDPVQDVLAKAPGRQDLQEELPHDDERVLPRSSAAKNLLGIMLL